MVVENLRVDVTPGGVPLIIHVSQYDAGLRQFVFTPYDKGVAMAKIAGATVTVEATKPDGFAVQHPCTYNNDGTITYTLREQLAACEGQVWSKLTWRGSNGEILGAKAIVWAVDMAGIEDGAIVSASDLPMIEQAAEFASEYQEKVAEMIAQMQIKEGQVVIDGTLTVPGAAADAKTTGDAITALEERVDEIVPGWGDMAKEALLQCFRHVAFIDADQDYYGILEDSLTAGALLSISAVFEPGGYIFSPTDDIEDLIPFLTVTAHYAGDVSSVVTDYSLVGALDAASSTITVIYNGKSTQFTVAVKQLPAGYVLKQYVETDRSQYINTGISESLAGGYSYRFKVMPVVVDPTVRQLAHLLSSTNWFTLVFRYDASPEKYYVAVNRYGGQQTSQGIVSSAWTSGQILECRAYTDNDNQIFIDNTKVIDCAQGDTKDAANMMCLFGYGGAVANNTYRYAGRLYFMKMYEIGTQNKTHDYVPCVNPSNVAGVYDMVTDQFLAPAVGTLVVG